MKKQAITLIFILLMILPSVVAHAQSKTPLPTKDDNTITLVLGTMLNVKETNESISGQALYLFYYESELWFKRGGIIKGLKEISFQKTPLFLLYQPGPFGQISYVYGFVRNFSINE